MMPEMHALPNQQSSAEK